VGAKCPCTTTTKHPGSPRPRPGPPGQPLTALAEDRAFWRAAGQRLLDCLEELPLAQKTAFLMHHDDELPVGDLAQALGVGFETAKTRLRYAMAKLRTCMGAYLPATAPTA
jgi:DNA-directed RNA polymerase specialized sigma24 family protein